jgi:hypothetical protein
LRHRRQIADLEAWQKLSSSSIAALQLAQAAAQTTFQPNTGRRTGTDYEELTMTRPTPQLCLDALILNSG